MGLTMTNTDRKQVYRGHDASNVTPSDPVVNQELDLVKHEHPGFASFGVRSRASPLKRTCQGSISPHSSWSSSAARARTSSNDWALHCSRASWQNLPHYSHSPCIMRTQEIVNSRRLQPTSFLICSPSHLILGVQETHMSLARMRTEARCS